MRAIRVNKAGCQSAQEETQSTGSGLRRERGQTPLPWLLGVGQLGTCVWPSQAGCPRLCWASDSLLNRAAPCLEERGEEKGGGDLQARKRAGGRKRLGERPGTGGQGHQGPGTPAVQCLDASAGLGKKLCCCRSLETQESPPHKQPEAVEMQKKIPRSAPGN